MQNNSLPLICLHLLTLRMNKARATAQKFGISKPRTLISTELAHESSRGLPRLKDPFIPSRAAPASFVYFPCIVGGIISCVN